MSILVAVLTIGLYCFCIVQRRPRSSMATCCWPAARFVVVDGMHGVGGGANN
ncbi:hypothetical protein PF005_g25092 [Phytophthora fragariae]|uniref:Uncharacterized protein n=1 Tax=Phytophthora fragariae TaxID=53985 RepID=A0A6A3WK98_9STRA|nr:hypothetical protein PF003_g20411 [Phytophthora fragariae]KAE8928476.1 hypothetical protein PF009_g21380 [Phytophthora fragariae]KAE8976735.1 hypothetical protein PF011_g23927 [Phytophthora fragariae]KAE9073926.1 hypothetical protein PF010_g24881 [Phytophthora fragariae]KAE9075036.1 hypothetical protein PF007_g25161 [Phytophthora fragariae]